MKGNRGIMSVMRHLSQPLFSLVLGRAALVVLLFSFIFQPLNAIAQTSEAPQIQPVSKVQPPLNDASASAVKAENTTQAEFDSAPPVQEFQNIEEPNSNSLNMSGTANALGVGSDENTPKTKERNFGVKALSASSEPGTFEYSVPISLPPGRNDLTPDLTLLYSSKNAQDSGFGYGWDISIPSITRYNKIGFGNLYSTTSPSTYFYSSLSGELASTSATTYVARNDDGSNLQYTFSGNTWTVKDESGNTFIFGPAAASRQDDPGGSGKIYKWMLQKVTDPNGNSITYSYTKDLGQIYPSTITYTDTASSTGPFAVNFSLGLQATSTATSSIAGFPVKTRYQINQINILTSGTTTRSYALIYGLGDNANRTTLRSVTETGQGLSGTLSLPPVTFEYSTSTASMMNTTSPYGPYVTSTNRALDEGVITIDANGDGVVDKIQSLEKRDSSGVVYMDYREAWIKTSYPGYSTSSPTYDPPCIITSQTDVPGKNIIQDGGGRLTDLNGDGLNDFVCGSAAYLNNGSNWVASSTWNTPVAMNTTDANGNSIDAGVRFGDVNGDGLTDLIKAFSVAGTFTNTVYLNNGNGWASSSSWALPYHLDFTRDSGQDGGGRTVDVNGDGLIDIYAGLDDSSTATSSVYINNGTGWAYDSKWILPDNIQVATTTGPIFADINNDGLVDISIANGYLASSTATSSLVWTDNRVYLNTGTGWKRDLTRSIPLAYNITVNGVVYDTSPRWGNFTGSGLNTLFVSSIVGAGGTAVTYNGEWSTQNVNADLLSKVTESGGKKIAVTYKSTSSYSSGLADFKLLNPKLPFYFPIVERVDYDDGINATYADQYRYTNGTYYYANATDRKFAGFDSIQHFDGTGVRTMHYYHTGKGTATSTGQFADNQSKIGQVYRTEIYDSGTSLYRVITRKWENFVRNAQANFVWPTRITQLDYDNKATHKDTSQEFSYSTTTGALLQSISWGQVNAANDGSFTDVGTDKLTTNLTYAASSSVPFKKLSRSVTTDQGGSTVVDTKYFYDNLASGSISKGNLTQQDDLKSGSTYIPTVRKFYNSLGLVTQDINARNATTTFSYDPLNLYPATTTNALGHTSTALYNYNLGIPSQLKDPNGAIVRTIFDPVDRITAILNPDVNATTTLATTTAYTYYDTGMPRLTLERNYLTASNIVSKYIYKDAFGRVVEEREQAEGANTYKVKDTTYKADGLVFKQSLPYFASGTAYTGTSSPPSSTLVRTFQYDPLQRITQESTYVNYLLHSYDNWKETTTDSLGKKKDYYSDAYGRLTNVVEYIGTTTATTTYVYDGSNSLTKVTDALGNIRNFTYDNLGRLLKLEDLHATADTSFGSTTYAYDDAGNITQTINPRGKVVTYTYDLLNRVKTENSPDTAYTDVTYTYDNSLHSGIGRLGNVSTAQIGTGYDYDWNGNLLAEQHLIPGSATTTTWYYYDRQNNPTYIFYPDNSQVFYGYNSAGLLEYVMQLESGGPSWTTLVSNYDYSPLDQVTTTQYGNGTVSVNTYTPSNLYWLGSRIAYNATTYLQYLVYGRNNEGHITSVQDASGTNTAKNLYFTYDDLYRLTSASSTAAVNGQNFKHTYSYNAIGNLLSNNGTNYLYQGNTGTNYANPHAATTIGAATNTYDVSGNLLTNGTLTNTWDYKDRLTQAVATIGTSTATSTYTYDQVGTRITKTDPGTGTTSYANQYYSITAGGNKTKYVFANDLLLATIDTVGTTTKIYYTYADPLESSNVVADSSGNIVEVLDYFAFGQPRFDQASTTFKTQRKYIGEYYDEASALNYLNARYYSGQRGQFLSQDPVFWEVGQTPNGITALSNPQLQNSYSYAGNNPISYSDPSGRFLETGFDVAMLSLSVYAFKQDPSFLNAAGVVLDGISVAVPIAPAIGGMSLRAAKAADATYSVYRGVDSSGTVRYVGITKRDPGVRFAEHGRATGSGRESLEYSAVPGTGNLTKNQARVQEQSLINQHGLKSNGGTLVNKVNSISQSSPLYSAVKNLNKSSAAISKASSAKSLSSALNSLSKALKQLSDALKKRR